MAIKRLEDELSCRLFERSSKGVLLTEHAKFLLPVAEKMVRHMDDVEYYFTSGMGKDLQLSVMSTWGADVEFAEVPFNEFKKRYPNIFLRLLVDFDTHCEVAVDTAEAEMALVSGPIDTEKYNCEFLYSTRYGISIRKDHPLAGRLQVGIKDLDSQPLVLMGENQKTLAVLEAAALAEGVPLNIQQLVNSTLLTYQYADKLQTVGITTQSFAARYLPSSLKFIPFDSAALSWVLYLVSQKHAKLSPTAELMRQLLLQHRDNILLDENRGV